MLRDYIAAGFAPEGFWTLTPRLYLYHMEGAAKRLEREAEAANHQAWNTAAMTGAAFAGKLKHFDKVFGKRLAPSARQSPEVQEALLMALARSLGA